MELTKNTEYQKLLENTRDTFQSSKDKIVSVINSGMLLPDINELKNKVREIIDKK